MVKHDPSTSVFNARGKFLHVAPVVSKYFRIDASDLVSEEYCRVFEADWRAELYGDMGVSDKILIECEHDVVGIGQLGDRENLRLHGVQTFVQFEPGELIVLAKAEFHACYRYGARIDQVNDVARPGRILRPAGQVH